MRLFEILEKHLPQQAGKATIQWSTRTTPKREGTIITLPIEEDGEFIPLKGGEQFLYLWRSHYGNQDHVLFGGTDENPFLAELDPGAKKAALAIPDHGEGVFYNYLKPESVKRLERLLGVTAPRQGDIFAVPVGWNWRMMRALAEHIGLATEGNETKTGEMRVFGTRHVLSGQWLTTITFWKERWGTKVEREQRALLATGVIEAPDHSPLVLNGVHALVQVEVLARPEEAD
ncbi:MAG: hypothetical protein A3B37_00775 [Candidatus Sungbacteria bacterium RIFCSPLOWO2_01_FULL_59_16]|uniref:Uncharacterized protein n=1 Tax=Candidatus Sungbacteria bacterium RIFCSPLOWO2_01_FULL_59_16 TaxID=1802280 RepID=A0A1G2LB76_9BACT|nr:MAG: hypothetical protein A3B37_00775 [Candidatus Sungbacteria bacterium RIFCSPLOWO2_01_FULL_59_16]